MARVDFPSCVCLQNDAMDSVQLVPDEAVLVKEEESAKGVVSFSVYRSYWTAVGHFLAPLIFFSLFLMQGGCTATCQCSPSTSKHATEEGPPTIARVWSKAGYWGEGGGMITMKGVLLIKPVSYSTCRDRLKGNSPSCSIG